MTPVLLLVLALIALYGVYIAARVARQDGAPGSFLDAGQALPGWAAMFLLPGLAIAALGAGPHLELVSRYGLQASHLAMGGVFVAIAALLLWNRLWYVTRLSGAGSPGEALGQFYGSVALRVVILCLSVLFALPFAANLMSQAGQLIEGATGGSIPRIAAIWMLSVPMAIAAIVGGWRATILTLALESLLLLVLLPVMTLIGEIVLPGPGFPGVPIPVAEGVLWDRIPAVIQSVGGIGKAVPPMGIFSATGIISGAIALLGIVLAPATLYVGQTMQGGRTLGVSAVWLTGGLATGILLTCAPLLAVRLVEGPVALAQVLHALAPLAGVGLLLVLVLSVLIAVHLFVTGGAILLTREFVLAYLLPALSPRAQRFAARVAIAVTFALMAFMASFLPLISAILASVALPLSVQLLPAFLGLAFFRWISRGAVLAGMIIGMLVVVFTEPVGLILFEGLFVELPWGRWPLTVHSAAWGLGLNIAFVLLASAVTQDVPDRPGRDRMHDAMRTLAHPDLRRYGVLQVLAAIWAYLACGPGALLGNTFFSDPIFTRLPAAPGIPSLWVWQILFWLLGVVVVWWLANRVGFGTLDADRIRPLRQDEPPRRYSPDWLGAALGRLTGNGR